MKIIDFINIFKLKFPHFHYLNAEKDYVGDCYFGDTKNTIIVKNIKVSEFDKFNNYLYNELFPKLVTNNDTIELPIVILFQKEE